MSSGAMLDEFRSFGWAGAIVATWLTCATAIHADALPPGREGVGIIEHTPGAHAE